MLPNGRAGNAADPRVKRTRQLIERAFEELLVEKGFQPLTVQDIADRATVNRATFYAHFEDKYALLDSYIRERFQQGLTATVPASAAFSVANLRQLAVAVFGFLEPLQNGHCRTSDQTLEPVFMHATLDELHRFLLDWLRHRSSTSAGPADASMLEATATVISGAILVAAVRWVAGDRSQPAEAVAGQVVDVLVAGLADLVVAPAAGQWGGRRETMAPAVGR
jgi:AcrR family transcriptional regulator